MKNADDLKTSTGHSDTFGVVQRVIAEVTGLDYEDITLDADIEEDLGIEMMSEFPAIVVRLQKELDVVLSMPVVRDCVTIAELVELIDDEREL
jgi:acyl carrier protein